MSTAPRRVLVIVTRRIGDVLLATPVLRSLRQAWPDAVIDALVFSSTAAVLAANPDVNHIHAIPERPEFLQHLVFIAKLFRRYDLALSLVPGDRPTLYAYIAGRKRIGLLLPTTKERWKRRLLHHWVPFDNLDTHSVRMHLALTDALGITSCPEVVVAWRDEDAQQVSALLGASTKPIAVLHTHPKFNYKMWHKQGWIEITQWLAARGFSVVLSGSEDAAELAYIADLARDMPSGTIIAAGKLSLAASAQLISRARIYVGPDTALTHVAAALGVPTIALFGPSNPVKWGPWARGHVVDTNPWRRCGSQRQGTVTLLQGTGSCVPCLLEGCDRNIASLSDCLQALPARRVIQAAEESLARFDMANDHSLK